MPIAVLTTKLHIPPPRPELVMRPHLMERLNAGVHRKLTLISASAGFGKTTLVSAWIAQSERQFAWVSLDHNDREPAHFLTYVITAIQTLYPHVGQELIDALEAAQPTQLDLLVTALINQIAELTEPFVLVLDDYHVLDSKPVDDLMKFLLDYLPPPLHLVITTREDPSFALSRMRARGEMTEIRVADLRFTADEAADFLNTGMQLKLSANQVALLEARTEGWIAGLQMAAISMNGHHDMDAFIESFTGSHRYILDYLVDEVLQNQPEDIVDFLLQTAMFERLSAALCAAVTEQENSQAILERLDRSNMLIVPLDNERHWYRYHHLFADVLRAYARQQYPQQVPIWQKRASIWYEQNGFRSQAVEYALAAQDFEHAAGLVELSWPVIPQGISPVTWLNWANQLPDEAFEVRPVLSAGCAWTLIDQGELDAAELHLQTVDRWLKAVEAEDDAPTAMVVTNHAQFEALAGTTASAYAYLSQARHDLDATIYHAERALELLAKHEQYWRGGAALFLGMAHWTKGNLSNAYAAITESIASLRAADNLYFQIFGTVILAEISVIQGQLRKALGHYQQALQLAQADNVNAATAQVSVSLYVGLGNLYREWDNLERAHHYIQTGFALRERAILAGSAYSLSITMAHICEAQGNLEEALNWLNQAERDYQATANPNLRPIPTLKAKLLLKQGRLAEATAWAEDQTNHLNQDDDLSFLLEFDYLTLVRVKLAQYAQQPDVQILESALDLLERLLQAAESGGRTGSIINILIVQALTHQAQENLSEAIVAIKRALTLAEPESYIRIFADEGQPMRQILSASLADGASPAYVTRLIQTIDRALTDTTSEPDPNAMLIEPLSTREREVLRLMADGLSNQAIADELFIAISTVKKHVNNIFGKLGVANRTQAVNRAREMKLV